MTKEQILALSGRELDEAVAEHIMGWRWVINAPRPNYKILLPSGRVKDPAPAPTEMPPDPVWSIADVPRYSTSLDACREAEKESLKMSSHAAYWSMLRNVVVGKDYLGSSAQMGHVATAAAEQRCRAMLITKLGELSQ